MKHLLLILSMFILNGCAETFALLGPASSAFSGGNVVTSSLHSAASYGIKKQTGKTPLGHALAYAEKINPEKKQDTCITFIEKTRSEFCTIAKKQISLTNSAIKEKVFKIVKKEPKKISIASKSIDIKSENKTATKDMTSIKKLNFSNNLNQSKKTPRELAIVFQAKLKKLKENYLK